MILTIFKHFADLLFKAFRLLFQQHRTQKFRPYARYLIHLGIYVLTCSRQFIHKNIWIFFPLSSLGLSGNCPIRKRQFFLKKKAVFSKEKGSFFQRKRQFFPKKKAVFSKEKDSFFLKKNTIFSTGKGIFIKKKVYSIPKFSHWCKI